MNSDMALMGVLVAMDSCCYREGEKNYPTILFFSLCWRTTLRDVCRIARLRNQLSITNHVLPL